LRKEIKDVINSLINSAVDPNNNYLGCNFSKVKKELETAMGNKVAAINDNNGASYQRKGHNYDPHLVSFILGSGGEISDFDIEENTSNALVIRGLGPKSRKAIQHCWETGRDFYAVDTGYFGNGKIKKYHRITKNNLQNIGPIVERDGIRLKKIGWKFKKFSSGSKILICPPSEKVMSLWNQLPPEEWTNQVVEELKKHTDRPIEIRLKPTRGERTSSKSIEAALAEDVHCLVTYNSIAATEALLNGKPAMALGPNAAQVLCNTQLSDVENLYYPTRDEVEAFARHLSYCQFTQKEMQDGTAWRIVNESN
jgi:hypothetical protein